MKDKVLKWNLDDIVTEKDFERLFNKTLKDADRYEYWYKKMRPSISVKLFNEFLKFSETSVKNLARLYYRAFLAEAVDQNSSEPKVMKSRVKELELKISDSSRKIRHWIKGKKVGNKKALDDKNAARLFKSAGDLNYVLEYMRETARHTLDNFTESIIQYKDSNGVRALEDLRSQIETEFEFQFKPEGRKKAKMLNQSQLTSYMHSPDPNERKEAYLVLLSKFRDNINKFYIIYQSVIKDWIYESKLRKYKSPISMRNKSNHVSDRAVLTLLDVCSENRKIYQDYFKLKAGMIGVKKISRFDIYAPVDKGRGNINFSDAKEEVMDCLKDFSEGFYRKAERIFKKEHIDSHPASAKQAGAFCATVSPGIEPYILLNFDGTKRDVLTLAHELGHGIHSLYAEKHSPSAQHANLPLSETASTFCEMIVFERLYREAKNTDAKKKLLVDKLGDSYAAVLRQNYFVKFELELYDKISGGLSPEDISEIYFNNLKEQFGNSVDVAPVFRYEWSYIPHFVHSPFYCYAYNFGELLSLSLYSRYKSEGKKFLPVIEKLLSAGGSENPEIVLKEAGVNINSGAFWQNAFEQVKSWVKELRALQEQK